MSEKENIREIILIGREVDSNFVANDPSVSRQHAQIIDYGTYYTVVDLGSTNGTYVNGKKVASETTLHSGDKLQVGNVVVPWEQLVQPPQKSKKAKVLLAILIPVIALLLIGGVVGAYFIWWHGKGINNELEKENRKKTTELSQQMTENKQKTEQFNKEKSELEQQKKDLDAAKKQAEKDKEVANREAEKAKKDAENAKKEAEKAKKEAEKAKKEAENAKTEVNTKTKEVKKEVEKEAKKKEEEKKKKIDTEEAQQNQELKNQYEKLKTSINNLSETKAKDVCYDLGMNLPLNAKFKNELLTEASKAYTNKDKARLEAIEKAIKKN